MEVEIIHREHIKPASPTPHHLRICKISLLDQLMPPVHVPLVFYYPNNPKTSHLEVIFKISQLRQSLSKTLVHFYPFAGKIKDDLYIECNDEGVYYVEAQVKNCQLSQLLRQPDGQLIHQLVPQYPSTTEPSIAGSYVVMIQVNIFDCSGIAITISTSHKFIDGSTYFTFLKAWAAMARGSDEGFSRPCFIASSLFPQNHLLPKDSTLAPWMLYLPKQGKCITRRFVFDASAISTLKVKASSSAVVKNPTSVETVSAFIWRRAMVASRARNGSQRPSVLSHAVNLRRRKVPPFPNNSIGNLLWTAPAICKAKANKELHCLVGYLREPIAKLNNNFIEELQGYDGFTKACEHLKDLGEVYSSESEDYFSCSSLFRVGIYEADFGWGKPMWVSPGQTNGPVLMNLFFLMETRRGDGIEAWVSLEEQHMGLLECDSELLAFASVDPSPCEIGQSSISRPCL